MTQLPYSTWIHIEEMKLRGIYLTSTIDLEFTIIMIITEALKHDYDEIKKYFKDKKGNTRDIKYGSMADRINAGKEIISKYYPLLFDKYQNCFIEADKLREVRNKFAHRKIDSLLTENSYTHITMHKLHSKGKVEHEIYEIRTLFEEIYEYKKTIQGLMRLLSEVMGKSLPIFS